MIWVVALLPSAVYVTLLWAYRWPLGLKREEIRSLLATGPTIERYQAAYNPAVLALSGRDLDDATKQALFVRRLFGQQYSVVLYLFPATVTVAVTSIVSFSVMLRWGVTFSSSPSATAVLEAITPGATWGFWGAYVWGLYDLLRRYRTIDLNPSSVNQVWLRMVIASLIGHLLGNMLEDQWEYVVAFSLGAFPLQTLKGLVEKVARVHLAGLPPNDQAETANLSYVQGMSPEVLGRLWEEDITRLQHLAFADPVKLFLSTDLRWKILLDLIDQAILVLYVGEKIGALRAIGIRGAIEAAAVGNELREAETRETALQLARRISAVLEKEESDVLSILETLRQDPQVRFIWHLWEESFPEPEGATNEAA